MLISFQTISSINYHNDIFITNSWEFPRGHGLSFIVFHAWPPKKISGKNFINMQAAVVGKLNLKIFAAIQFNLFILIVWFVLGR
jgi:hypothetical protein